jgi:hypothetical protein
MYKRGTITNFNTCTTKCPNIIRCCAPRWSTCGGVCCNALRRGPLDGTSVILCGGEMCSGRVTDNHQPKVRKAGLSFVGYKNVQLRYLVSPSNWQSPPFLHLLCHHELFLARVNMQYPFRCQSAEQDFVGFFRNIVQEIGVRHTSFS